MKQDQELKFRYLLGWKLGKSLDEIDAMTQAEYLGWQCMYEELTKLDSAVYAQGLIGNGR